jgi:two-component system nitrate/nitrite sensor histidine kinase NarX
MGIKPSDPLTGPPPESPRPCRPPSQPPGAHPRRPPAAVFAKVSPPQARPALPAPVPTPALADGEWRAPLQRLLQAVVTLAGARAGALRLLDADDGGLLLVSAVGDLSVNALESRQQPGSDCGVCSDALRLDQACAAAATCACARAVTRQLNEAAQERVYVLPLHHGQAPCGVLNLFFDAAPEVPATLSALLPAMGDMLGLALENHRLARRALHDSVTLERLMLAGEVHDSLAQSLTWMRMRVALLRGAIDQGDRLACERYLKDIDGSLACAHGRMRELICEFRTRMDPQGLVQALRQVAEQLGSVAGLQVEVIDEAGALELSAEQELQVFHIAREALANVAKHAGARHAALHLLREHGLVHLRVDDDGVGLPQDQTGHGDRQDHFGLDLMRERARLIGGRIELLRRSGRGTSLRLQFPELPGTATHHE